MKSPLTVIAILLVLVAGCGTTSRISIYDRFRESEEGTIVDLVTGLQWMVGPDRDFDWYGAQQWIADLEGDWRMPTRDELEELFDAGITTETWGPFDNSGWMVWCVDFTSSNMSYRFCFIPNDVFLFSHIDAPSGQRVWAVLAPRSYGTTALLLPTNMPQFEPI